MSKRLRWAGQIARMEQFRNSYRVLVGNPEGKISVVRSRRRWEDNIKMDLRNVGCDAGDCIDLVKIGPMAGLCKSVNEPP